MEKLTRPRTILTALALVLVGLLVYSEFKTIGETWELLRRLDWQALLLLPLFQILSFVAISLYYRAFFQTFGTKVKWWRLYGMVHALSFVNVILPSGGLSGITYMIYGLRHKVSTATVTLAQLGRYIFSYASYFLVMVAALYFLLTGDSTNSRIYVYMVALVITALPGFFVILFILAKRERVDTVIGSIGRFIDWLSRFARSGKPLFGKKKIQQTLTEFYSGYQEFRKNSTDLVRPLIFMAISTIFEVSIVISSFMIVGQGGINIGIIMVAFAIANAVGVISVVPGDVGVHETAMIAVLALAGVPAAMAISGTLLYRVFNKLLFIPVGFYFYTRLLKPATTKS